MTSDDGLMRLAECFEELVAELSRMRPGIEKAAEALARLSEPVAPPIWISERPWDR